MQEFTQDPHWTLEDEALLASLHRACTHYLLSGLSPEVKQALLKTDVVIGWHYRYVIEIYAATLEEAQYLANCHEAIVSRLQNLLGAFHFTIAEGHPGKSRKVLLKYIRGVDA